MSDNFRRERLGEWTPIDPAAVLAAMPLGVDLDLAQVASRAELLPRDAQRALDYFVEVGLVVKGERAQLAASSIQAGAGMTVPRVTADDLAAIRRRWSRDGGMGNDRSEEDYTDAGCRVLARAAFRDVAALLDEIDRLREQVEQNAATITTYKATANGALVLRDQYAGDLAAAQTQLAAARELCDDYRANCDPKSTQAQVAELFRAALAEGPAPGTTT